MPSTPSLWAFPKGSLTSLSCGVQLKEVKDPFGNAHKLGVLGITRKTAAGDVTTERVDPATALWLGVKETWFVVDRTLSYIGGVFTGREAADIGQRPVNHEPGLLDAEPQRGSGIDALGGDIAGRGLAGNAEHPELMGISEGVFDFLELRSATQGSQRPLRKCP